ncbi:unnamed protein product, partial [Cladocopium goreaui]
MQTRTDRWAVARQAWLTRLRQAGPHEIFRALIRTIVDGEQVAKMAVMPGDMVVRMETTDRELQVYSAGAFARDFQLPGEEIQDASPEMQALNSRGYKCYWHQGVALLYQVTEEDVE